MGLESLIEGKLNQEDSCNYLNVMLLFVISYYNYLLVCDADDFFSKNIINKKKLGHLIKELIKLISKNIWFDDESS